MKKIRIGCFETNSSSVHSLTMCTEEEFEKFKIDPNMYVKTYIPDGTDKNKKIFYTKEEVKEYLLELDYYKNTNMDDEDQFLEALDDEGGFETWNDIIDNEDGYESFSQKFTTPLGERIIGFGYFGFE